MAWKKKKKRLVCTLFICSLQPFSFVVYYLFWACFDFWWGVIKGVIGSWFLYVELVNLICLPERCCLSTANIFVTVYNLLSILSFLTSIKVLNFITEANIWMWFCRKNRSTSWWIPISRPIWRRWWLNSLKIWLYLGVEGPLYRSGLLLKSCGCTFKTGLHISVQVLYCCHQYLGSLGIWVGMSRYLTSENWCRLSELSSGQYEVDR